MPGLAQAYAFSDDPFKLENSFPATVAPEYRMDLATGPLKIAEERALLEWYCDKIYSHTDPFRKGTPLDLFQKAMASRQYSNHPQSVDNLRRSGLILLRGHNGTGKTTAAHRMIRWLMDCAGPTHWKPPILWIGREKEDSTAGQIASLQEVRAEIKAGGDGKYLCLFDDILKDVEKEIFKMYSVLQPPNRVLYFFITSSDPAILERIYAAQNPLVITYETRPLTPDGAIEYCKHRFVRVRPNAPASIAAFPLFPFTEDIIRLCVTSTAAGDQPGPLGLPQFNVRMSEALEIGKEALPNDFDIANVPVAKVADFLVDPSAPLTQGKVA